jgi:outer membrane receptor protein involved in Fe transport
MFRATLLCLGLVGISQAALAQVTTGAISGTVRDATSGVLPGAAVTVKHVQTGMTRTAVTDDQGHYRVTNLNLGDYEVDAALSGFQTEVRKGVTLTIGREAVVDFAMRLGEVSESVVVTGEAPLVDTTSSSVAGLIDEKAIRDLPLSGRDFIQLALLEPSVLRITNSDNTIAKGFGTRTTFAGSRPRQNVFLMDGTNVNNMTNFAVPGSVAGVVLGVDTVREFQVLVGSYSAEYAGAGGTLSAVTRSGTNQLHGTGFWFHRNDALDSKNFFDREKPDFTRNQFGLTAGGPIVRDRLFFFGSYEGLRDRLGVTQIGTVPDENARLGLVPNAQGQLVNVGVHPAVKPYLDLNPLPNGRNFGDGRAEFVWSAKEPTDQNYIVGKVDYSYAKAHSLFVRYTFDDSDTMKTTSLPLFRPLWTNRNQWVTAENRMVLSSRSILIGRFGYTRSNVFGDDIVAPDQTFDERLLFVPGQAFGSASFVPSRDTRAPRINITNSVQYTGQFIHERGQHSLKIGGDVTRYIYDFTSVSFIAGQYTFTSLTNFLRNQAQRLSIRSTAEPRIERQIRMTVGGFFLQDDMRLTQNLTLNAGLRYEPYQVPFEAQGLESTLKHPLDPEFTVGSPVFRNPSWKNFGPRVGVNWNVTGDGRLALRGGGGVYHDVLVPLIYRNVFSNSPPYSNVVTVNNPIFPDAVAAQQQPGSPARINPDGIAYDVTQPRLYHFNLQLDAQLGPTMVLTVGYVGSRGFNQVLLTDANTVLPDILPDGRKFYPTGRGQRNPNFGGSWYRVTEGQSFYNGLRMKLNKRFSDGVMFGVSYSLGKAVDDGSTDVGQTDFQSTLPQDNDDPKAERGLANFDVRHNLSAHFSANLPWGENLSGVGKALLAGWQVNGIASVASGSPFTVLVGFDNANVRSRTFSQRPSLVPGASNNPVLGGPDLYFDPLAFQLAEPGFLGDVGRNTVIAPGLALLDMSLVKSFAMGGERRMEFRIEGFNILNRANFGRPSAQVFDAGGRVGDAGRITNTTTAARQVQLGLKFLF